MNLNKIIVIENNKYFNLKFLNFNEIFFFFKIFFI
jgi:hypothetical protein